jgi:glycerol-3-phosphate dehydrogenase
VIARDEALAAFESERFDVVVIGGGITGAGVAFDAATRGYSAALIERDDYAAGTSSRSSKLVHGGLRYLQNFDLGLVREALLERSILVNLAPHLVRPLQMLVPAFEGKRPERLMGVGLNMYDVMATERGAWRRRRRDVDADGVPDWYPERHRIIEGDEVLRLAPALADREPNAAYLFYDCQTDDVRLVLTVLGEAERYGAVMANRCEALGLLDQGGRADGVRVRDTVSGREIELRADNVVNATGVWADRIRPEELHDEASVPNIRPSRGTHITLSHDDLPIDVGIIVPAGGGRSIFALPWLGRTLVGTTDNDYEGSVDHVQPPVDDVDYLLDACRQFFARDLSFADVTGAYAGVRPLISLGDDKKSVDISRKAELFETSSGMVTITGGKLTTWRRMAKMTVDRIVERDGRDAPCRTHEIQLGLPIDAEQMPAVEGVEESTYAMLAGRYGHAALELLQLAEARPDLRRPIVPGHPDLLAEAVFAAQHEQARTVGDVLLRRTRLGLLDARALCAPDAEGPRAVARALGDELGWDDARVDREVAAWYELAAAEGLDVSKLAPAPAG